MVEHSNSPREGFHAISRETGQEVMSRIVAVCGITDEESASPSVDGRFFSDFYLFNHLCNPLHNPTSAQIWLTCVEPDRLVARYGEYAHGGPKKEQRVVLDEDLLPGIKRAGTLRVVNKLDLFERFVKTVEEQAREAKKSGKHLILLIFGHGDDTSHGVYLGGAGRRTERAIPKELKTTILLTSCYSGGWLIQPDVNYRKPLNVTGITASGPDQQTRSRSLSRSASRACGSTIASAILSQLVSIDERKGTEEDEDPRAHPAYIELAASIYDKATSIDPLFSGQHVHFSAQDDDWEAHWRARTGFPLAKLQERWETLRQIPPSGAKYTCGGNSQVPNRQLGSLQADLNRFAQRYFAANPDRDSWASNVGLHGSLRQFFEGNPAMCTRERVQWMLEKVVFRLNMMADADELVKAMGFEYESCLGFSIEDHQLEPETSKDARKALMHFRAVRLFSTAAGADVPHYMKPEQYLSIVLAERCNSEAEMKERVEKALKWKELRAAVLLPHVQGYKILEDNHVRAKLQTCISALRDIGHRLHVKTPSSRTIHQLCGYTKVDPGTVPPP
ncbi:hypothetical protein BJX61DRAFT_530670 [Aspergillus egyptiacus]|nr:hypothetical protein BJX61DRAFT_530670 [Aspergillus egyptiacus]